MEKNKENEEIFSLIDIFVILVKNKNIILCITIIAFLLILFMVILSLSLPASSSFNFFPNIYKPKIVVLLKKPGESQSSISSLLSNSNLNPLIGILGGSAGAGSSDLGELIKLLLHTNELRDNITNEFKFKEKYKIEKYINTQCRNIFSKNISIEVDYKSNTINVAYTDTDPVFATNIVTRTVQELEKKVKSLYSENTSINKSFLEERIAEKEYELNKLQNNMIEYQNQYGIFNISSQVETSVTFISELQADIMKKELDLKALEKNSPYDKTSIGILQSEIMVTKQLVDKLKKGETDYSKTFIPLDNLPELTKQYLNYNKDLTIQSLILETLKQQYEAVKIEESDKSQVFTVLEWADVPELKDSPRRSLIIIIVVITAFILSIIIVFIKEYFNNIKKDTIENDKLIYIRKQLFTIAKITKKK